MFVERAFDRDGRARSADYAAFAGAGFRHSRTRPNTIALRNSEITVHVRSRSSEEPGTKLSTSIHSDGAAYRYLAESIRRFPPQAAFAKKIEKAGFTQVKHRNLSGGIAAMHSGWKA